MWHTISFVKYAFWSLNFKNHTNYTISIPPYFSIQFWYNSLFIYLLVPG